MSSNQALVFLGMTPKAQTMKNTYFGGQQNSNLWYVKGHSLPRNWRAKCGKGGNICKSWV